MVFLVISMCPTESESTIFNIISAQVLVSTQSETIFSVFYRTILNSEWSKRALTEKFTQSTSTYTRTILQYLSYDVTSGSEIAPCNKIGKPRVVYRFSRNVMTSITRLCT